MKNTFDSATISKLDELVGILSNAKRIVAMTGAGISVPSGIPDFRSANGLYNTKYGDYPPETMLSHTFYEYATEEFFKFYKEKMLYPDAKPNAAHKLLASLERSGKRVDIVTQNIDGLHQKAGSKNVHELHGSVLRNYCETCHKAFGVETIINSEGVPHCDRCGGRIKPDVVLYEEGLDSRTMDAALRATRAADVMLVIGTSLVVYPAASFVFEFAGDKAVLINKGETSYDGVADIVLPIDCAAVAEYVMAKMGL